MCGIAGFCCDSLDRAALIRAMTDRMRHRGPDAEGFWLDERSG
jgi:asparagine synthase (glutamine-hydrolysing)